MRVRAICVGVGLAVVSGCGGQASHAVSSEADAKNKRQVSKETAPVAPHDHAMIGPHGGPIVEWGDEEYHPELAVDRATRTATVYVLDGDARKAKAITAKQITVTLRLKPAATIVLTASPQQGDAAGASSRFVGVHAAFAEAGEVAGSISAEFDGKPYSGDFNSSKPAAQAPESDELKKVNAESVGGTPFEHDLYLKPGGVYTAEDVRANGNTVPSVKFKGKHWPHDDDLKTGDKVCPVTDNKSDNDCTWIVGGKKYQFCCTPCIDKFVKWAKTTPAKIKPPETYVKR